MSEFPRNSIFLRSTKFVGDFGGSSGMFGHSQVNDFFFSYPKTKKKKKNFFFSTVMGLWVVGQGWLHGMVSVHLHAYGRFLLFLYSDTVFFFFFSNTDYLRTCIIYKII